MLRLTSEKQKIGNIQSAESILHSVMQIYTENKTDTKIKALHHFKVKYLYYCISSAQELLQLLSEHINIMKMQPFNR